MEEVQKVINQTPIEIALGIGEDGMTTARNLFDFLEMNPANYARWIKRNITNNEFAEENVDYFPFVVKEECEDDKNSSARKSLTGRGNSEDYKLSSAFAKKLSMQQKNERGEQARNYFVGVEDKAKDLVLILKQASGDPMKLLKLHYEALEQVDKKVVEVDGKVGQLENRITDLEETMNLDHGQQRQLEKAVNKTVIKILGGKESNAYKEIGRKVFCECNGNLKDYFKVNARGDVPRKRYDEAIAYAEKWRPCINTQMMIEQYNAQQSLELEGGAVNE